MREGYKDTPIGMIPEDWEVVKVEDILMDYQNGYAFSSSEYVNIGIPIISMSNISLNGKFQFDYSKCKHWSSTDLQKLENYLLKQGDLLIAMTDVTPDLNLIGRMAIINIEDQFLLNQRVGLLRVDKTKVIPKFLCEYGNSEKWLRYSKTCASLGAQANLSTKDIKQGLIPLPSLSEQSKISILLSTVDDKIDTITDRITHTQKLKNGLMQRLLTRGIGHTKFKDSPLGEIPESWDVVKFGEICNNITGKYSLPKGRCIDLEHVEQGTGRIIGHDEISDKSSTKNHFKSNDVLFGKLRPYLRKFWLAEFEGACTTEFLIFRSSNGYNTNFLFLIVQQEQFIQNAVGNSFGTKMPRTNWKTIADFMVAAPPISEQIEIADIFITFVEKLNVLQEKKTEYSRLKNGLMQQLLTGKIRVKV